MDFQKFGFRRVASVCPVLHLGEPEKNIREILYCAEKTAFVGAIVTLFPEMAITGYTCDDLFHTADLLERSHAALKELVRQTVGLKTVLIVGAPYEYMDRLYNAAFVIYNGRVHAVVPKSYLPNYHEFYDERYFHSGIDIDAEVFDFNSCFFLTTRQLINIDGMRCGIEICEDMFAPVKPGTQHALHGARVIFNPSASNELVGKVEYRQMLVKMRSADLNLAYVYSSSGMMESTKDTVFSGHLMIAENGSMLVERRGFDLDSQMILTDIDIEKLKLERIQNKTFADTKVEGPAYHEVKLSVQMEMKGLLRKFPKYPFVPDDVKELNARAEEIIGIQATGLVRRMLESKTEKLVLGLSGGLDSTLALLVSIEAMKKLGKSPKDIIAITMPGFGTSKETKNSAYDLAKLMGVTFRDIPIVKSVRQHFRDIGQDPKKYDITFENAQARMRTMILFDIANQVNGLVVGTGDLSELAKGWCTYNGDHMASYGVNAGVPKTLVQYLIRWYADHKAEPKVCKRLKVILKTEISPELLPPGKDGKIAQKTEDKIGSYVLTDFFLFHYLRNRYGVIKILAIAEETFTGDFTRDELKRWLKDFIWRFHTQQFKRTTLPAGPKVGSVSLSPRADWRMPDEVNPERLLKMIDEAK